MAITSRKTVSLALGSGGARGLAHIGVIHWLEENHYEVRAIAGSSIGALIGGIYSAGKLGEFEQWVRAITKVDIVTLLDLSWAKSGLVKGDKIINTLVDLVGEQVIENLSVQYTAVATDLTNQKEIWINSGRLFDAIRASMSVPLLCTPFKHRGLELIDGGVLNPVPVAPTIGAGTDLTLAVNLGGPAESQEKPSDMSSAPAFHSSPWHERIKRFVHHVQRSVTSSTGRDWGAYDIAMQAFEAMQSTIARQKLAAYPPDRVIEIARNACGTLEFDRAAEMIELGHRKAKQCLSQVTGQAWQDEG